MFRLLVFKSLMNRKFISFLCVLSIALSLALFLAIEKLRNGVEEGFTNTISQADLIVGARSGPLQLLLYTVFHMGEPTNNIRYSSYEKIKNNPMVEWTIPISLGDSYKGHRVIATNESFFTHYRFRSDQKITIKEGQWSLGVFDVVLGSKVSREQGLSLGDELILSHGLSESAELQHDQSPFKVAGIMNSTGTPLDKAVFISLEGMEAMHIGWETGVPRGKTIDYQGLDKNELRPDQITSFILKSKNPIVLLGLRRFIANYQGEPLMGIIPALTLTQLWSLLDQLEQAFLTISYFVILIGFLSVLISLYMSLNERQREVAILRSLGVSPWHITWLLIFEATLLAVLGGLLGLALQYGFLLVLKPFLESQYSVILPLGVPSTREFLVISFFIFLGPISGVIPALKAYKMSLHQGLVAKS